MLRDLHQRGSTARHTIALGVLLLVSALARNGLGQTSGARPGREEEARRKLLEQMGLEKKEGKREPAPAPAPPPGEPEALREPAAAAPPKPSERAAPAPVVFVGGVHDALLKSCRPCHAAGGTAAASRLVLTGQAARDHASARALVAPGNVGASLLYTKGSGSVVHGGGPSLPAGSEAHRRIARWIVGGALLNPPVPGTVADVTARLEGPKPVPERLQKGGAPAVVAAPAPTPAPALESPVSAAPATPPPPVAEPPSLPGIAASAPTAAWPGARFHEELVRACLPCHRPDGPAAMTRFVLTGAIEPDLAASAAFLDATHSAGSLLAAKARGEAHAGGALWTGESAGARALAAWLSAGAPTSPPAAAPAPSVGAVAVRTPAPSAPAPVGVPVAAAPHAPDAVAGASRRFDLLGSTFTLNGRFDVNLERRGFEANPFAAEGETAIQSYHHFVFLGRESTGDPFTFTAELTSLLFYEAGVRLGPKTQRFGFHLRAGKLLVPFGNEPIFHQQYGGHIGFDQRVLPAVWAAEGLAASAHLPLSAVTLTGDLYGVRGYGLRRPDAVLNLQSDFSPVEDARPAVGLRLGAGLGPLTGYYSAYFNPLGYDRRLFMQAIDVSLWRLRAIPQLGPVLSRLVLAAGLLRADVSGGGAGADYYHFASYWLARIYAREWLALQYRQGLRTFDNRGWLVYDERHRGSEDGSTHNFALTVRVGGFSVSASYYLNFEKAEEVDDDLARLSVAYEF